MTTPGQIKKWMSLRQPQTEAQERLHRVSNGINYRKTAPEKVARRAAEITEKEITFDTVFPSLCFTLATGVGKTRLMGASIYYLYKTKGYCNFFFLFNISKIFKRGDADFRFHRFNEYLEPLFGYSAGDGRSGCVDG